jgi:hypothetical protein
MLGWWYSRGWLWILQSTQSRLQTIGKTFAVKMLIQTWFSPWKQIYAPKPTFATFIRDAVDNAVSRSVGFVVRGAILLCALLLSIFALAFGIFSLLVWPFLPLLMFILPVIAISGAGF